MISNNDFALIAALDLNPIKVKLMHKQSGEGWSAERTNAIETEYRRFLYLMNAFPDAQVAPTVDVDTFWHYHILDTMKYARDCERTFGRFLHHYPYLGLEGEDGVEVQQQAGERMRELYESTFGLSYVRPLRDDGTLEAADVQMAWSPAMGEAANSAWCPAPGQGVAGTMEVTPYGRAPQAGVSQAANTAWCAGPGIVKAADVQTAWCAGPGIVKAADVQTAWCAGPGIVKAAGVQTAWCAGPGIVKAADVQTAWCAGPGIVKAADVQTALGIAQAA
jgi:hypothetical protein